MTLDRALGRGALFIRAPRLAEQQHAQNFAKYVYDEESQLRIDNIAPKMDYGLVAIL